jgi:SAM-dependent methyltransferase
MNAGYTPQPLAARVGEAASARGWRAVAGEFARWGSELVVGMPWTLAGSHGAFALGGERYPYLFDRYKFTWLTERAVEVPVVQRIVDRHRPERVLEIGNVLSHYRPQSHRVIDKYEPGPGVQNLDVMELSGFGRFDLIVAVSTLEHVGHDEHPRDSGKAPDALRLLRTLLAPEGRLVITVPVGYNPAFEQFLRSGSIELARLVALRRLAAGPHWREIPPDQAWSVPYDFLLYSARAVLVASFGADS